MSHEQSDSENIWDELVGDAFTPDEPLPPPPEFAGAIDEEMQARASARLPLHVVPISGPDSDALPIDVVERPRSVAPERTAPLRKPVVEMPRSQHEADAVAAPQVEVAADPVVEVEVGRRRRLPPTLRTSAVRPHDELDVVLFEVAQTGPHAVVSARHRGAEDPEVDASMQVDEEFEVFADDMVELDLDIDDIEVELTEAQDDNVVAGEIDISDPVAPSRGSDPARALLRSAAIANAMRGATVRVPLVPERKVKTAIGSLSGPGAARGSLHPARATTVRTASLARNSGQPITGTAVPVKPATIKTTPVGPAKPTTLKTTPVGPRADGSSPAVPRIVIDAPAMPVPGVTPVPGSSASLRRVAIGEGVVNGRRRRLAWAIGGAAIALGALLVAALPGDDEHATTDRTAAAVVESSAATAEALPTVVASEPSAAAASPALEPGGGGAPSTTEAGGSEAPATASTPDAAASDASPTERVVAEAAQPAGEEARRAAGEAYVAAVARYEAEQSNDALEAMVVAACEMDDGPRARTAYRKLRGRDPRSRAMLFCRPRGIDLWARGNGYTASELLRMAKRQLTAGDTAQALESARESNRIGRSNEALVVMGIALCKLGRATEIDELDRHLSATARAEIDALCAGA